MATAEQSKLPAYSRRRPESTILYRTIQENFETFLTIARREEGPSFPLHVHREVDAYLGCGILARGFVRVRCTSCRVEKLVAFSCKMRGFCPFCGGRRMNEVALHLTDSVFPKVPVRQWVLSFPFSVRYALAYSPALVTKVLSIYIRVVSNWYLKRARRAGVNGKTGAVTFVQRFGGAINLNVHFHSLFLDGVFAGRDGKLKFVPVLPPTDAEIVTLVGRINARVTRCLRKRGYELEDFSEDPFAHEQPIFAHIAGASIQSRIGVGERAGLRVRRIGGERIRGMAYSVEPRCAVSDGFSLHADVQIRRNDRKRLEKLCRYTARPPIALDRMSETNDGKILYRLKTRYTDGTTHVLFDPLELVEKVVALIPPPRANLLRYHGILAPNAKGRAEIVPARKQRKKATDNSGHVKWSELLKKTFGFDVLKCDRCGGKMRIIATVEDPRVIREYLEAAELWSDPPRRSPSRAPPQAEFPVEPARQDDGFSQLAEAETD